MICQHNKVSAGKKNNNNNNAVVFVTKNTNVTINDLPESISQFLPSDTYHEAIAQSYFDLRNDFVNRNEVWWKEEDEENEITNFINTITASYTSKKNQMESLEGHFGSLKCVRAAWRKKKINELIVEDKNKKNSSKKKKIEEKKNIEQEEKIKEKDMIFFQYNAMVYTKYNDN